MSVAGPEARHVEGAATMRSIEGGNTGGGSTGRRLDTLVESAAACASRREDYKGHGSSCGGVKAAGTSTSVSPTAAAMRGKHALPVVGRDQALSYHSMPLSL